MYLVRPPYLIKKLFPAAVWRMDALQKKIYLTFDDGPIPVVTPWVLDLLKQEEIKATFFCVGNNVENNPEIYKRILAEGHGVGNHTYNHLNGWNTDTAKYIENVNTCARLVDSKLFRPPYGKLKKSQIKILQSKVQSPKSKVSVLDTQYSIPNTEYSIIMWDVLSGDYDLKTGKRQCLTNTTSHVRNGSIVLFHDSNKAREKLEYALPRFIEFAKEEGYEFGVVGQ